MRAKAQAADTEGHAFAIRDGRHSEAAADIARGTMRLLAGLGMTPVLEFTLANWRRADIAALGPKGEIWIVEVKSNRVDFETDQKWPDYLDFCDRFLFAVDPTFPTEILPEETGLILADRYGGEILREAPADRLPAARRRTVTLGLARTAAQRLHGALDPDFSVLEI
jgi:hypothetical protein